MGIEFRYFILPKILAGVVVVLAVVLGLIFSGYTPLDNILHLKATVSYYVTVPITKTTTIVMVSTIINTTTINHFEVVTSTITSFINRTITTTVRDTIITPVTITETVNYTTTSLITITLTPPPTSTVNQTIPSINYTKAEYDPEYFIEAYKNYTRQITPYFTLLGLKPIVQFACYATGFRLANGSNGVIIVLVGNTTGVVTLGYPYQFPHGVEWGSLMWAMLGVNTTSPILAGDYATVGGPLFGYSVGNITITGMVAGFGFTSPRFPYIMPNGTYTVWLLNWNQTGVIYPCILQVINTWNWNNLANYTYLGSQYVAYAISAIEYGKPAPCYMPWIWTTGYPVARLHITEPIGANWQYYCGENGLWRNLKP